MLSPQQLNQQCSHCQQTFTSTSDTDFFNATRTYPDVRCPKCQKIDTYKRGRGRDEGQSHILHGPCANCGSPTEYYALSMGQHTQFCLECSNNAYSSSSY